MRVQIIALKKAFFESAVLQNRFLFWRETRRTAPEQTLFHKILSPFSVKIQVMIGLARDDQPLYDTLKKAIILSIFTPPHAPSYPPTLSIFLPPANPVPVGGENKTFDSEDDADKVTDEESKSDVISPTNIDAAAGISNGKTPQGNEDEDKKGGKADEIVSQEVASARPWSAVQQTSTPLSSSISSKNAKETIPPFSTRARPEWIAPTSFCAIQKNA